MGPHLTKEENIMTIDKDTCIIEEILAAEPSVAYVKLSRAIAEAEEALASTTGWFWRKPALGAGDKAEQEARLNLMRVALQQVTATLAGREEMPINVQVNNTTIQL